MKSKISCCNAGLLRRSVLRGAPLWGLWTLGWLILLPLHLLSNPSPDFIYAKEYTLGLTQVGTVLVFGYGLLVAWYQFAWLYRTRSAYHYGSLPLRRGTQFLTRYFSGLLFHLVPAAVTALLTVLVAALQGTSCIRVAGTFFAATSLVYLFYYSLAVLIAQLVGNTAALPLLYLVLNFTSLVLETILSEVLRTFTFGMVSGQDLWPDWLSPVYYALRRNLFGYKINWDPNTGDFLSIHFTGWVPALIFGAVGLGFAVLAFLFFRKRHLESAGDVIAVPFLRPVFLYALALGCGIVLGRVLSAALFTDDQTRFVPLLFSMLVCTALGYWAGQMLLHKSLRVLSKGNWIRCGAVMAVMAAGMLCCRYDVTGFSRYVPAADDVKSVTLSYDIGQITDRDIIDRTVALHQEIVDQRYAIEAQLREASSFTYFSVTYEMQDGSTASRRFRLPVGRYGDDRSSLAWAASELQSDQKVLLERYFPAGGKPAYDQFTVEYLDTEWVYQQMELTYDQAEALAEAIQADIEAGTLGGDGVAWPYERNQYDLQVQMAYYVSGQRLSYDSIFVTAAAEHTCAVLRELGVPEAVIAGESAD